MNISGSPAIPRDIQKENKTEYPGSLAIP
jgi:hypothetical protein